MSNKDKLRGWKATPARELEPAMRIVELDESTPAERDAQQQPMKIEFCCEEMQFAMSENRVQYDIKHGISVYRDDNEIEEFVLYDSCPYCGSKIDITVKGDNNAD